MTLNQIIKKIQTAAESHKMVGKFGVGQQSNLTVENVEYYPLVWLYPDGFNLSTTGNLMTYNFALLVMDRVFESESNDTNQTVPSNSMMSSALAFITSHAALVSAGFSVKIIIYLRDQVDFLQSLYAQMIKSNLQDSSI